MSPEGGSQDYDNLPARRGENETGPKRARVSQACEQCRTRRGKCDGRRPTCSMCEDMGQDCVYDPNPKKRGVPAGSNSTLERRTLLLELLLACLLERVGDLEMVARDFLCPNHGNPGSGELLAKRANILLGSWRQSTTSELVQSLSVDPSSLAALWQSLAGYGKTLTMPHINDGRNGKEVISRAGTGNFNLGNDLLTIRLAVPTGNAKQPLPSSTERIRIEDIGHVSGSGQPALPSDAMRYLDLYFTTTHTWLPMVDRYRLSSFVKQYSGNQAPPTAPHECSVLCLTWAIIAQVGYQSPQACHAAYNNGGIALTALQTARSLIPQEDAPSLQVEYVQALILLSLTQFSRHAWRSSWILITLAGRSGLSSEQPSRWWHDRPMASTQLRTFLACITVESFLSLSLGFTPETGNFRPLHNITAASSSIVEVEEIGWEEWASYDDPSTIGSAKSEPWRAMSAFNRMANLIQIMTKWISINHAALSSLERSRAYLCARQDLLDWRSRTDNNYPHLILDYSRTTQRHIILLELAYWIQHCILDLRFGGETVNRNAKSLQATKVEELVGMYRQQHGLKAGSVIIFSALCAIQHFQANDLNTRDAIQTLLDEVCESDNREGTGAAAINYPPTSTDRVRAASSSSNELPRDKHAESLFSRRSEFPLGQQRTLQSTEASFKVHDLETHQEDPRAAQILPDIQPDYTGDRAVSGSSKTRIASYAPLNTGHATADPSADSDAQYGGSYITGDQETTSFQMPCDSCETGLMLGESASQNPSQRDLELSEQNLAWLDVVDW